LTKSETYVTSFRQVELDPRVARQGGRATTSPGLFETFLTTTPARGPEGGKFFIFSAYNPLKSLD
jgi:hypothetical protein